MKFSFLIYSYFPFGGQQRDFLRIANESVNRGHQVDVYFLRWQGEVPENLNLIKVPVKAWTRVKLYQNYTKWVAQALANAEPSTIVGFNKMPLLDIYFAADPCFAEKAETQRGYYYKLTPRYRHFYSYEKAIFGPGVIWLKNFTSIDVEKKWLVEERSILKIDGDKIYGTEKNLAKVLY